MIGDECHIVLTGSLLWVTNVIFDVQTFGRQTSGQRLSQVKSGVNKVTGLRFV